jgi:hypothetical protein
MKKLIGSLLVFGFLLVSSGVWAQSIDGVPIGSTLPSTGKFTNLEATTQITLGAETITNFSGLDDDKVKVSSGDTADFLESQIVGGTGVSVNSDGSQITISAPPVNVQDNTDGVEITFARESSIAPALDLNGTDLFIGTTDPTVTIGGLARTVLSKGTIPNTTPTLQQVIIDLPNGQLDGEHKLKLVNTQGFSEGFISLGSIGGNDKFTKLLLHGDGTGNSFVDSSASEQTITAVGNVTQSTAQSQFGGKSILFDGTGDYLSIADNEDLDLGTGDFTIDTWIKANGGSGNDYFLTKDDGTGIKHIALRIETSTGVIGGFIGTTSFATTTNVLNA